MKRTPRRLIGTMLILLLLCLYTLALGHVGGDYVTGIVIVASSLLLVGVLGSVAYLLAWCFSD